MFYLPAQPASIGKILDASIKLYVASFSKSLGFYLFMVVFYISIGIISQQMQSLQAANAIGLIFGLVALILIMSLLSLSFYAAMIYRVDNVANDREDTLMEALGFGLKKFPSLFLAILLYMLAVMGGFIALVIPGIILSMSLYLYFYFIVIDDLGGYRALRASHDLVWGHWWRTLTVFMAPGIIIMVFYVVFGLLIGFFVAFTGSAGAAETAGKLAELVINVFSAFFTPYFFTLGYVQFHDLKLRKSGADLALRLAK